jgi:hypothetical protein
MPSRVYFYDAMTREEIVCEHSGSEPRRSHGGAASPRTNVSFDDTYLMVEVKSRGRNVVITADTFGDRLVVVCDWSTGGYRKYSLLVSERDGFRYCQKGDVDGTIMHNRKALEWIAARRAARQSAAPVA